ncbi:hypothetical protein [Anaerosinus gibii]|uniref:Uncharacterized protein n=1 Tax=Selenobaculum gibii TaxID=3054208 RepID=A0A9Y2AGV0_9FIRM|nr:hypothetical protein [Selenobaculum gbiensis]WIW69882.1 hypothetical protein P3F81_08110 [Selenobaculum gbiensis]
MDKIEFKIVKISFDDGCQSDDCLYDVIAIFINGENLLDMVKECELPFATAEKKKSLAGSYIGIIPKELYEDLSKNFTKWKVPIYGCTCGCVECWPLEVAIDIGKDVVVWYDFEQIHRKTWQYNKLGKFSFNKQQYFEEVEKLKNYREKLPFI